jgi:mono/diheme cytochrome c family protein
MPGCVAQDASSADQLRQAIVLAGNDYRAGKIDEAVAILNRTTTQLQKLAMEAENAKVLGNLKTLHGGLAKAYQRLELDGVELEPLPTWDKILEAAASSKKKPGNKSTGGEPMAASGQVNFATEIAPWLVSKCSRCHITDAKGGFSMKTLDELMKGSKAGKVVFAKDAAGSRLVEVIESGDMPRGGGKVPPADLDKLKKWIEQGCVFDPKIATTALASLGGGSANKIEPTNRDVSAMVQRPTGKETVSFSRDVAPLLLANCKGCHIDARQQSGDLNMDSFVRLLRGGESGAIVQAKKSSESLLIKKLLGKSGDRMPAGGKPPFRPEQIQLIAKWIDEGMAFDGYSADANIEEVASRAWAESASAEDLMKRRLERALDKWSKVFPTQEPLQATGGEYVVLGNVGQRGLDEVLASTKVAMEKVRKALKKQEQDPLAKGGVTIFVIKSRYDYSEFGKMAESRSLPSQWTGHWRREILDVYVTLLYDEKDPKANEANLTQQLASLWISANKETPNWFANGFGRAVLAMVAGRNEPKVKAWDQQIPAILGGMKDPKELLTGKMNEEDAAIIGYGMVRKMMDTAGRKPFDQFLRAIDSTHDFEKAFTQSVGPVEPAVGAILGLKAPAKKR